jgi:hypothetical protein
LWEENPLFIDRDIQDDKNNGHLEKGGFFFDLSVNNKEDVKGCGLFDKG